MKKNILRGTARLGPKKLVMIAISPLNNIYIPIILGHYAAEHNHKISTANIAYTHLSGTS
jgi:hypothetical protein